MAHICGKCGLKCHCGGDIDDLVFDSGRYCIHCEDPEDDYEEIEFNACGKCDGHAACEDFGCAYEAGLGRMVKKNIPPGFDDWG